MKSKIWVRVPLLATFISFYTYFPSFNGANANNNNMLIFVVKLNFKVKNFIFFFFNIRRGFSNFSKFAYSKKVIEKYDLS